MHEDIKNLILSIAAGDAVEADTLFTSIMDAKAAEQVNDMQVNIAQTMFNPPVQEDAEFEGLEEGDTEKIDELKGSTIGNYFDKAADDTAGYHAAGRAGRANQTSYKNRSKGLDLAIRRLKAKEGAN